MARAGKRPIPIDGERLTLEAVEAIADGAACVLARSVAPRVRRSRARIDRAVAEGRQLYGVNTGFGRLARIAVPLADLRQLQTNLVRSHAAGVGPPLPERVVRAILALRANCLSRGHSGLRLETLERLVEMLRFDIVPLVPELGSVGASGDLAPLAHVALALVGEGDVLVGGRRVPAAAALRRRRLAPLRLEPKEGIALINGTQVMSAIGLLALLRAERLSRLADVCGAASLEALRGSHRAFDARIHDARPHPGQGASAANLRRLLRGSAIERSHRDCGRVQDCYSLRCMPQVHGAVRDALAHVRRVLEIEINSSSDNPMVFAADGAVLSGGNFHGQPVSLALDHLATAVCSLATISERRVERLVNPDHSELPAFLARKPGLESGLMMAQVTAAALVADCRLQAHPASVDTIPTSANIEDHVSMGVHAALKAERAVARVALVLGIEMLCAAQALDLLRPLRPGAGVEAAREAFRREVPRLDGDRVLAPILEQARATLESDDLRRRVEARAGALR